MFGKSKFSWRALAALAVTAAGCGNEPQHDLEVMRESVVAALDTWKQAERGDALRSRSPPIEFYDDDWGRGARLVDYTLNKTYLDTDGAPRCAVTLSIQRRGKTETIDVTYQAKVSTTIVIARDPYS